VIVVTTVIDEDILFLLPDSCGGTTRNGNSTRTDIA